jgi:hypothetical protein
LAAVAMTALVVTAVDMTAVALDVLTPKLSFRAERQGGTDGIGVHLGLDNELDDHVAVLGHKVLALLRHRLRHERAQHLKKRLY